MTNIFFMGDDRTTSYVCSPFLNLIDWLDKQTKLCTDTETNVVDSILERKLKVISLGNMSGDTIWVIEWEYLILSQQMILLESIRLKLNIIHNVSFDYKMFKLNGCTLEKVWDTMLAEQVLFNGFASDKGHYGLKAIYLRRFDLDISKEEQLSFGEGPYNDKQIQYAAVDVIRLGVLYNLQVKEMRAIDSRVGQRGNLGLMKTMWWENEFVKVVADMEMTGVRLDKEKWYAIEDEIKPIYEKELKALNAKVKEDFRDVLIHNNWISDTDDFVTPIWSSAAKKKTILEKVYDFPIEKTAKTELKKLLQSNDPDFPEGLKLSGKAWEESDYPATFNSKFALLKLIIADAGDNSDQVRGWLDGFLLTNLKQFCIEQGWLRPANQLTLNWASPAQRLKIFQAIDTKITSTGKDVLEDFIGSHVIIQHYLSWNDVEYQLKNFGRGFYDKHVELDGKHRTRFNQILATGRLSSVQPNMLNIPRKKSVYRSAIIPDPGYTLIDADYDGQELVITTEISQEPSWMRYLELGYDLHSKNAELIFGQEWIDGTEPGCAYYGTDLETDDSELIYPADGSHPYKKCGCKVHDELRDNSKAVSFGSIYGISYIKLAFNLKIPEDRAKFILKRFFEIVPGVANMMENFGRFAIQNGYIIEPVFGRMRNFDKWKLAIPQEHGAIERAAFNTPIQSSGSAILKIAFVLMRRRLNQDNLNDVMQLLLPYHDETIAQAKPGFVVSGKLLVERYMMLAAKLAGFDVKAGAKSGKSWLEAH